MFKVLETEGSPNSMVIYVETLHCPLQGRYVIYRISFVDGAWQNATSYQVSM